METKVNFYNDDCHWYAEVPEHIKAENIMVGGADAFLEQAFNHFGNTNSWQKILSIVITDYQERNSLFRLAMTSHNQHGAYYRVDTLSTKVYGVITVDTVWLCNVVHTVCGEHPKEIYIRQID